VNILVPKKLKKETEKGKLKKIGSGKKPKPNLSRKNGNGKRENDVRLNTMQ